MVSYFGCVKHIYTETFKQNMDTGVLVIRLFIGIRLVSGGLRRFIEWERTEQFHSFLANLGHHFSVAIPLTIFFIQVLAGLAFLSGYKMKWAAAAVGAVCLFLVISVPWKLILDAAMPPFTTMVISLVFLFLSPGKFSLEYRLRHKPHSGRKN